MVRAGRPPSLSGEVNKAHSLGRSAHLGALASSLHELLYQASNTLKLREHVLYTEVGNVSREGPGNRPKATQLGSQEAGVHAGPRDAPSQPPTALVYRNLNQQEKGTFLWKLGT